MKTPAPFLYTCLLVAMGFTTSAQAKKESEDLKVSYSNRNGKKELLVTEKVNGKTKTSVFRGEEADRKLEELNGDKNVWARSFDTDIDSAFSWPKVDVQPDGRITIRTEKNGKIQEEVIDIDSLNVLSDRGIQEMFEEIRRNMDSMPHRFDEGPRRKLPSMHGRDSNGNQSTIQIEEELELSPEEIQRLYGIDVKRLSGEEPIIEVRKRIRVKRESPK
jgi:hypothetical protein